MQVYRGLPILTNQPETRPGWSGSGDLDHEARSPSTSGSRTRRSTTSSRRGRTPVVVGGTGLYLRAALAELELPPRAGSRARASGWSALYDEPAASRRTRSLAERDPAAAGASTRTTGAASCARSSSPRPGRARGQTASGGETRGIRRSSSASSVPRDELAPRIEERTRADVRARASRRRCGGARGPALRRPPRKALGLREVAELPARAGDRGADRAHAPLRGLPAQVDAPDPGPC